MKLNLSTDFLIDSIKNIDKIYPYLQPQGVIDTKKNFGEEHYKLFAAISMQLNNCKILEIGTHEGNSAVILSYGKLFGNNIYIKTYDINNLVGKNCKTFFDKYKIDYVLDNIFNHEYRELHKAEILAYDIIFIDIDPHNGILEYDMYCWLQTNNYKGLILFDDIFLGLGHKANNYDATNSKMIDFWNKIESKHKINLTSIGHWSGTGLVCFDFSLHTIILDSMYNLYQIILKPYNQIPKYLIDYHNKLNNNLNHCIYNDDNAITFLQNNFPKKVLTAFKNGNGKWKADLLRFCLMNIYNGLYLDVDLKLNISIKDFNIPLNIDTVLCIGAFTPSEGLNPLPKGELAIGFILCNTPEPLFLEYINYMNPYTISKGDPYAINIQGLYIFLCKRWNIEYIEPFKIYNDDQTNRKYYFLKEVQIDNKYKIINQSNIILVHSQEIAHSEFI
jgi:predicted O-methyltransferase YrrM